MFSKNSHIQTIVKPILEEVIPGRVAISFSTFMLLDVNAFLSQSTLQIIYLNFKVPTHSTDELIQI